MDFKFDNNRFELLEWFSYPCCVCDRTVEYEENGWHRDTRGDKDVKDFFNACLKKAEEISGRHSLMDNKIAIKVYDKETDTYFYVGYKDNIWAIGPCLNPYMNSCYTIKLKNNEKE